MGSYFMSDFFKNRCEKLGNNKTSARAHDPQGNAMIERTNLTIKESLAKYVDEHHNTWSDYLSLVMMAYRSSIHPVTKYIPFDLLFGQSCALPTGCMYHTIQAKIYPIFIDYVSCLKKELKQSHELVRESMDVEQKRHKTYYDRSTFGPKYEIGDFVMVFNPIIERGQTKKFNTFYSGPQIIREIINDLISVIEYVKTEKSKKVNLIHSNVLTAEVLPLIKKENKNAKSDPIKAPNDHTEDNDFVETREEKFFLKGIIVKLTLVLKLAMRQSMRNCLKHQCMGVKESY